MGVLGVTGSGELKLTGSKFCKRRTFLYALSLRRLSTVFVSPPPSLNAKQINANDNVETGSLREATGRDRGS